MNILCTICSDIINQAESLYVTNCGHIFHHDCLTEWMERSQTCPQCRHKATHKCIRRIYPTISNVDSDEDAATLQSRLDNAQLLIRQNEAECKRKDEIIMRHCTELQTNIIALRNTEKRLANNSATIATLKTHLEYVKNQSEGKQRLEEENEVLKKKIQTLADLEKVLNASTEEVEHLIITDKDAEATIIYCSALKRALTDCQSQKNSFRDQLYAVRQILAAEKTKNHQLTGKFTEVKERLSRYERQKRKVSDLDTSFTEESSKIIEKLLCLPPDPDLFDDFAGSSLDNSGTFTAMVNRIKHADSPYLNLKHSSVAFSTMQRPSTSKASTRDNATDTEVRSRSENTKKNALTTENTPANKQNNDNSIFSKKELPRLKMSEGGAVIQDNVNIAYDGLGGHSRVDTFPTQSRLNLRRNKVIPKLTEKHKLKNPNADRR